jgi:flagellar FliJ protein
VKRFAFNLEKALKLRKHREKETEIELGRAVGALIQIERAIEATAEEQNMTVAERFSAGFTVNDILVFDHYLQRLDASKARLVLEAEKASAQVEEARNIYLEASRDRKILSNVKERREKEYHKEMLAEEIKTLDDIASGSTSRRLISTGDA